MTNKNFKIRVIALLQSGNGIIQDFNTNQYGKALVQFGENNAKVLSSDPLRDVSWIEIGREGWSESEELELTESYFSDMITQFEGKRVNFSFES
jgi:hypothetical protein